MLDLYRIFLIKKIKLYNAINIITILFVVFFIFLSPALASIDSTMKGLNSAASQGYLGSAGEEEVESNNGIITDIPSMIGKIVGLALSFIGLIFFVLMIYGGFVWMFARGNDQNVQKAKDLIEAAVIGLIIVLAAYAITMFIGNALTSGSGASNTAR